MRNHTTPLLCNVLFLDVIVCAECPGAQDSTNSGSQGYYRFPALYSNTIVFAAEGDLWRVGTEGGRAQRLTSHPGSESLPSISPAGKLLAFSAEYEGATEVYSMPLDGGLPTRRTFGGRGALVAGWTPAGRILFATMQYSTLPNRQLATVGLKDNDTELVPLSQASDGAYDPEGKTLYFVRLPFQGSSTKRYKGGTIQHIWKFTPGEPEAVELTADFAGTSKSPMWWQGRIYFVSDRDGTMNLWSMNPTGGDLKQITTHKGWDVKSPSLSQGRIAYQLGADLHLLDLGSKSDRLVPIALTSDFDHEREKWVKRPIDYLTSAQISPTGDRLALTARGQVFVAPVDQGRFVEVTREARIRYRGAQFMPDGQTLIALTDVTGELEFCRLPANGVGGPETLTHDGKVFRFDGLPSPDGKWIVYGDKDWRLWLLNLDDKKAEQIASSTVSPFDDFAWSPDSQWLAYVRTADNTYPQIWVRRVKTGEQVAVTSDRVNSYSPVWSSDGKWLYLLSERRLETIVRSPWGLRQPEPYFDLPVGIYQVALTSGLRSPFQPEDELHLPPKEKKKEDKEKEGKDKTDKKKDAKETKDDKAGGEETNGVPNVTVELAGIQSRVELVPVPTGNYSSLSMNAKRLFLRSAGTGLEGETNVSLKYVEITNTDPKLQVFAESINNYDLSLDRKKVLIRKQDSFYVVNSDASGPAKLEKSVKLGDWSFPLDPREEWRQMFTEAWRLERDFFYDRNLHGLDWPAILKKYLPLVDRVTDRAELSDLISEMVGELSALHIFVTGGDFRATPDQVRVAGLGARLVPDPSAGGWRVAHIYQHDPDYPERAAPLVRPSVNVVEGEILEMINGQSLLNNDPGEFLRNQAQKQVLVRVKTPATGRSREVIVNPMTLDQEAGLRYDEWEFTRRLKVEDLGKGQIGYVHLRAMGAGDIAQWAREFYPVYQRPGLIVDVRHNGGGNIDSWILEKLMRKAWFFWQGRAGDPYWNMQYAFRGHVVVLCDERTGSDGEAFTEGFKRLGLGKVIGTRTWGGEIWLSFNNWLVDKGIASAAEYGVYGPEGKWLIEGHGVDPDIVVDNLPHASFEGEDLQLQRAIEYLQKEIRDKPITVPPPPPHPNKSFN